MRRALLIGLALLAGCGHAAPRPPALTLHFRASDGRRLHGRFEPLARRVPAVILVHGLYGEPSQWKAFVPFLHRAGFATLAYASRSDHEPDEGVLVRDGVGAVRALRARRDVDPDRIVLMGSSVGGAAVAYALATRPGLPVGGGVALSPIPGPREIALGKRHAFNPHGLLLISDEREAQTSRGLLADAHGRGITLLTSETPGHGIELLDDPAVRTRAIAWLER